MLNKLKLLSLFSYPHLYRLMLWLWAGFSVFIIIAFVRFLSLADENNVTSIHYDQLIQIFTTLDVISMLALPDFWQISLSAKAGNTAMFLGGYSAVSLLIFSVGLCTYHKNIETLSRRQVFMLLICAGWAHLLLAKCILMFSIPVKLTGPVTAVGALSVLYFSLLALIFDTYLSLRRKTL
ncbi:MAG: hypothetical protein GYB58_19690 [Gammaproteobacteria bacterium]|nr:hypothetical protein [Gammaproteobacteria bacterium]